MEEDENVSSQVRDAFRGVQGTFIVIVSSKAFEKQPKMKARFAACCSEIMDQARSLGLDVSDEAEFSILSHSCMVFFPIYSLYVTNSITVN